MDAKGYRGEWNGQGKARRTWCLGNNKKVYICIFYRDHHQRMPDTSKLGGITLVDGDDGEERGRDAFSGDSCRSVGLGLNANTPYIESTCIR